MEMKTRQAVQFELSAGTRRSLGDWISAASLRLHRRAGAADTQDLPSMLAAALARARLERAPATARRRSSR